MMFAKFRPHGDRVLVKLIDEEERTAGGIIIPDAAKEKTQTGVILAVGPGPKDANGKHIPLEVQVGDTIYFGKYAGTEAGKAHLIIREDEILGIVER
jgi:chaperonin GroES